jgi:hypothetical protein
VPRWSGVGAEDDARAHAGDPKHHSHGERRSGVVAPAAVRHQLDLLKPHGCNLVFNGKFVLAPSGPEELSKLELIMGLKYASFFVVLRTDET